MSFSNYYENVVLDNLFSTTRYLGLSTTDPTDDGSGLAEPSGNGYSRVTTIASDWADAASGQITNTSELTFPEATGSWGTVTHFVIFDSSGNILVYGALDSSLEISSGITKFLASGLTITQD